MVLNNTENKEDSAQYPDTNLQHNTSNDIKLFDIWNNKYFTIKPGSRPRK